MALVIPSRPSSAAGQRHKPPKPTSSIASPAPVNDDYVPAFVAGILRIEVTGPNGLDLAIVDLPGLIQGSEDGEAVQLVGKLVDGYLKEPRTIILAVFPARSDIATQTIIRRPRTSDKIGERTVGIITKVNLTTSQSLASNRRCWRLNSKCRIHLRLAITASQILLQRPFSRPPPFGRTSAIMALHHQTKESHLVRGLPSTPAGLYRRASRPSFPELARSTLELQNRVQCLFSACNRRQPGSPQVFLDRRSSIGCKIYPRHPITANQALSQRLGRPSPDG